MRAALKALGVRFMVDADFDGKAGFTVDFADLPDTADVRALIKSDARILQTDKGFWFPA